MGKQIIAGRCNMCDHSVRAELCGTAAGVTNPLQEASLQLNFKKDLEVQCYCGI